VSFQTPMDRAKFVSKRSSRRPGLAQHGVTSRTGDIGRTTGNDAHELRRFRCDGPIASMGIGELHHTMEAGSIATAAVAEPHTSSGEDEFNEGTSKVAGAGELSRNGRLLWPWPAVSSGC
jgi:hypothetical protein